MNITKMIRKPITISLDNMYKIYSKLSKEITSENADMSQIVNNICRCENIDILLLHMLKTMYNKLSILSNINQFKEILTKEDYVKALDNIYTEKLLIVYLNCFKIVGLTLDHLKNVLYYNCNILHYAILNKEYDIISWLFKQGFTMNDINSWTLYCIAHKNDITLMSWILFDKEIPINTVKDKKNYVLEIASTKGNIEIVKLLIKKGLKLKDIRSRRNICFRKAASYGHLEVMKLYRSMGLCLNDMRSQRNYALRHSARYNHIDMFKWLIYEGLTLNDVIDKDFEAYYRARHNKNEEIIEFMEDIPYFKEELEDKITWDKESYI